MLQSLSLIYLFKFVFLLQTEMRKEHMHGLWHKIRFTVMLITFQIY